MGKHSTNKSLDLFDFLEEMGNLLKYYVDKEYPMSSNSFGSQAIDIAWFNEEKSKFPLFIFEIESSSNNSIANNPTKVFGKESKVFEKPLFFFHIIIDSAENSEKYSDLLGLFGKYNYEIFKINNGELESLLIKIIAQHRRIHDEVDLYSIIKLIKDKDTIINEIKMDDFLISIENLIHNNQYIRIGQIYSDIASEDKFFIEHYIKFIYRSYSKHSLKSLSYYTYCASITAEFINLGILHYSYWKELSNVDFNNLLINAQKTDTFNLIQYLPGLNFDYDVFIHDFVPFYLALTFTLFKGNKEAQKYIFNIWLEIVRQLPITNEFILEHHASWGLLISATSENVYEFFEEIRELVNNNGGIFDTILLNPIFRNEHIKLPDSKLIQVQSKKEYLLKMQEEFNHLDCNLSLLQIAVMSLSDYWKDGMECSVDLGINLAIYIIKGIDNE